MNETTLSKNLTDLRNARGVTQETAAEAIGVSPKTLSKWENTASEPELSMLCALAKYYGVTTDYLLGLAEQNATVTAETAVKDEIEALPAEEAIRKTFALSMYGIERLASRMIHDRNWGASPVIPENTIAPSARSVIESDSLYALGVNRDALNMTLLLLGNKEQFAWLWDGTVLDRLSGLFALLSDKGALCLMREIHTRNFPDSFSAGYAAKRAGIPAEDAENLLDGMCSYDILHGETAHLAVGDRKIYTTDGDSMTFALIALAYEKVFGINSNHYALHGDSRLVTQRIGTSCAEAPCETRKEEA